MAVRIRLTRLGRKKKPFYRIIVADSERARDGKFGDGDIRGVLAPEAANDAKEKLETAGAVIELA